MLARSFVAIESPFVPVDAFLRVPAEFPYCPEAIPPGTLESGAYTLRFATTPEELRAVQTLRYNVFFDGSGPRATQATGIDADVRDPWLHHLIICHRDSGAIVGTYRLQTTSMAGSRYGFYSDTLFELGAMPEQVLSRAVEVGRACVAPNHRHGRVLRLLWRGIARYMLWNDMRFLFGCCSLPGVDLHIAINAWRTVHARSWLHDRIMIPPRGAHQALPDGGRARPLTTVESLSASLSPLFDSYITLGARVCSAPALDREFGTTDFLVLLDIVDLSPHAYRSLFG